MIGRTERRKEGGKKAEKNRRERKKEKERRREGRKKENKKDFERRKGRDRLPTGGIFVEKNTKESNASLSLISVKKMEQSEHFFFPF